jgi:hypothetical protein
MAVCNTTGMLAIYNPSKNLFMSPMADGPLKFVGSLDGKNMHIENVTKFGRNFSVISVPYSLKLLMQELQTMNVQMRLITEDNIQQLENMTYSHNIDKLMNVKNIEPQKIVDDIKRNLLMKKSNEKKEQYNITQINPENIPYSEYSPAYNPSSITPNVNQVNENEENLNSSMYNPFTPSTPPAPTLFGPTTPSTPPAPTLFEPTTPSIEPPTSSSLSRGGYTDHEISLGDKVHLRGDTIMPNRIWNVTKVGDQFITIETENTQGLNTYDTVKVVEPMA